MFGKEGEGFHALRIPFLDMALWDTVGTILIIVLICYFSKLNWVIVSLFIIITTVFLHKLFCVEDHLHNYLPLILLLSAIVLWIFYKD